jgi:hypothetical protein
MAKMRKNKIIYTLTVEDIQTVANDTLDRDLNNDEIEKVTETLGDVIKWYDNIESAIIMTDGVKR